MTPNPLQGLMTNPLFAVGLQILNNNRRQPRSQYQGPLAGVNEAMMGAAYQKRMAQQDALQQEQMGRQRRDWEVQDQERARREQAMQALQGALGPQQLPSDVMADEPPSVQAMGAPQYPANPLNPQAIQSIMMGGDSAMQNAAITSALTGQKFNRPLVVGRSLVDPMTGKPMYTAPDDPNDLTFEQRKELAMLRAGQAGGQPYFNFMGATDENGQPYIAVGNARTGQLTRGEVPGMGTAVKSSDSVPLQSALAGGKKGAQVEADARTNARLDLPKVEAQAAQTIGLVQALRDHPGMPQVVGAPNVLTLGGRVPATEGANFRVRLDQLKGQQFLQAYETLKGGGQITEVEGTKAENAIARMQTSQSEAEFKKAADEFIAIIDASMKRAKAKAGGANPALPSAGMEIAPNQGGIKFLGFE